MTRVEPRSRSTDQRYYGVVPALVEEIDGDDEGRVKLRFPWFDDGTVTDWCRVSQLYAGNGYGACFVPEKGDEVLVAFVHGDMRFPIVLGGLYNGQDKPPTSRREGRDRKMIRTRHGHQLIFDDQEKQAAVQVISAAGHRVELDDAGKAVRITAAPGGTIAVEADGAITLKSRQSVTIDAPRIALGNGATEPVVLGTQLTTQFAAHVHATPAGPSSPPSTPLTVTSGTVSTR
ncbi:phage baseplate assembly protein V [Actinoplanes sp. NPDC051851]|uniref:phage baseplate assembly protein V n=1 Tax=Actinoplanes sp. NPDC051851 TaxID=3154753 RepID=UPI003425B165